jgi:FtsZ-interacting cell division protein ZipA
MSDLRWILLAVGVVFLILLTAWESRRSRLARAAARDRARAMADMLPFEQTASVSDASGGPEIGELPGRIGEGIELDAAERAGDEEFLIDADVAMDADGSHEVIRAKRAERAAAPEMSGVAVDLEATDEALLPGGPHRHGDAGESSSPQDGAADGGADGAAEVSLSPREAPIPGEVSVEWPPEEQRRIVSVRIVSTGEQRFSGRTTRQVLAACGFVHGPYRIFHQPDSEGHALLSCASLSKPGVFDPASMDYQRYSGLSLFTVLPGTLSAPEAVDHLLNTALELSGHLQGRLLDDEGHALDAARIAELRSRYHTSDAVAGPPA